MRDFKIDYTNLFNFSNSNPYNSIEKEFQGLYSELCLQQEKYNFPAIHSDIGSFISFMMEFWNPKTVFEMGSGYGHSAFWFLLGNNLDKIILTEKRKDLESVFHGLAWPLDWKDKIEYHQADAFDVLDGIDSVDMVLIDGVKADYLKCLRLLEGKMSEGSVVLIDNSYWRGSFLDKDLVEKKLSAKKIKELHEFIQQSSSWSGVFIPYIDGLTLLKRTNS